MEKEARSKKTKLRAISLEKIINFDKAPRFVKPYRIIFAEYRLADKFHYLLNNFFYLLKNVCQFLIILLFDYDATGQCLLVLLAEIFYFGHTLVCNIKVSLSLRIVDIVTELGMVAYLGLKIVTTIPSISEDTRQKQLATAMVVCVYGIIVVSISFALFSLMLILFQLSKQMIEKCKSKTKVSELRKKHAQKKKSDSIDFGHEADNQQQGQPPDNSVAELKSNDVSANLQGVYALQNESLGFNNTKVVEQKPARSSPNKSIRSRKTNQRQRPKLVSPAQPIMEEDNEQKLNAAEQKDSLPRFSTKMRQEAQWNLHFL